MVGGGLLAALAFVISALVQFQVNKYLPHLAPSGHAYVSVMNTLDDCTVNVTVANYTATVVPRNSLVNNNTIKEMFNVEKGDISFSFEYNGAACYLNVLPTEQTFKIDSAKDQFNFLHISRHGMFMAPVGTKKPTDGTGEFSTGLTIATDTPYNGNMVFCRVSNDQPTDCDPKKKSNYYSYEQKYDDKNKKSDLVGDGKFYYHTRDGVSSNNYALVFDVKGVRPGNWSLYYLTGDPKKKDEVKATFAGVTFKRLVQGGVYMLSIDDESIGGKLVNTTEFLVVPDNGISILWQIPQIVTITAAEILFSITGLEFSYTQAAPSMKSVVGALFLLTTAVGDFIIVVLSLIHISDNVGIVFIVYAIMMTVTIFIFAILAIFYYDYTTHAVEEDNNDGNNELNDKTSGGTSTNSSSTTARRRRRSHLLKQAAISDVAYDPKEDAWNVRL